MEEEQDMAAGWGNGEKAPALKMLVFSLQMEEEESISVLGQARKEKGRACGSMRSEIFFSVSGLDKGEN